MREVAHDGDLEAVQVAKVLADGVEVEHGLRGVLVLAVAGVDDHGVGVLGDALRGASELCTAHEHVHVHGGDGLDGVGKALSLDHRGGAAAHGERVCREALLGQLEGALGARGGLEEEVHDGAAAQGRDLLDGAVVHRLERCRGVQDLRDVVSREAIGVNEVLDREHYLSPPSMPQISTASWSSSGRAQTRTSSSCEEGTFFPT